MCASLNPCDSFIAFDKGKLICLAQFYSAEFSNVEILVLDNQLETYIVDLRSHDGFTSLKGINDFSIKLVETKKKYCVPIGVLTCEISFDITGFYCIS